MPDQTMFSSAEFNIKTAQAAAQALSRVFARRTHIKVILGEERRVSGTLGQAVNLPTICKRLESRSVKARERGLTEFKSLWETLSEPTRRAVLEDIGWYDPNELAWDDPRSNRRPDLSEDSL